MPKLSILSLAACFCLFLQLTALANDTNQLGSTSETVWGTETNGLRGGIRMQAAYNVVVVVSQTGTLPPTANPMTYDPVLSQQLHRPVQIMLGGISPDWFGPTNGYCGLIRVEDKNGNVVPELVPSLCDPGAYPDSLRWSEIQSRVGKGLTLFPLGKNIMCYRKVSVADQPLTVECGPFSITNLFHLTSPGEYRLTVWPKLYRRSADNPDLFKRLDIAPVSVKITIPSALPK
jgi:hypothetical protein